MIQNKDYILQLIEEIGNAVAKIIGFKEQGSYSQALETLEDCYSEHFDKIHIESESKSTKLDLYGSLLKQEAEINLSIGNQEKARSLFFKSTEDSKKSRNRK